MLAESSGGFLVVLAECLVNGEILEWGALQTRRECCFWCKMGICKPLWGVFWKSLSDLVPQETVEGITKAALKWACTFEGIPSRQRCGRPEDAIVLYSRPDYQLPRFSSQLHCKASKRKGVLKSVRKEVLQMISLLKFSLQIAAIEQHQRNGTRRPENGAHITFDHPQSNSSNCTPVYVHQPISPVSLFGSPFSLVLPLLHRSDRERERERERERQR